MFQKNLKVGDIIIRIRYDHTIAPIEDCIREQDPDNKDYLIYRYVATITSFGIDYIHALPLLKKDKGEGVTLYYIEFKKSTEVIRLATEQEIEEWKLFVGL